MHSPMLRFLVHGAHIGGYAVLCFTHPDHFLHAYAYSLLLIGATLHAVALWWSDVD